MPNCDFYAVGKDHRLLLEFVFSLNDCDVYELGSPVDQSIAQFRILADVCDRYGIASWDIGAEESIFLQIHPRAARGHVVFKKVLFGPKHKGPGTFCYETSGWGLIQLYLESAHGRRLRHSHTNHNSESRALAWQATYPNLGPVAEWDWSVVNRWSRRLNRFIQKCGVDKLYQRAVLPEAKRLSEDGFELAMA